MPPGHAPRRPPPPFPCHASHSRAQPRQADTAPSRAGSGALQRPRRRRLAQAPTSTSIPTHRRRPPGVRGEFGVPGMLESRDSRGVDRAAPPGEGGLASDRAMANGPAGRGIRSGAGLVRESSSGMPAAATARGKNQHVSGPGGCRGVVLGAGPRGSRGSVIGPIHAPTDPTPEAPAALAAAHLETTGLDPDGSQTSAPSKASASALAR